MAKVDIEKLLSPKFVKFLFTGVINTFFGYAVFAVLLYVNTSYLIALFLATIAGVIFNYFSFGRMVFSSKNNWFVFGKFVFAYAVIYGVNAVFLRTLTKNYSLSPYLGQLICIPLSVFLSWILMNYWVYKKD